MIRIAPEPDACLLAHPLRSDSIWRPEFEETEGTVVEEQLGAVWRRARLSIYQFYISYSRAAARLTFSGSLALALLSVIGDGLWQRFFVPRGCSKARP